jgi:hypothetical protein
MWFPLLWFECVHTCHSLLECLCFDLRWLHPIKFAEILDMYEFMYPSEDTCGRTLLRKVYVEEWRACLRIRKSSQHTQCKDCNCEEVLGHF